MAIIVQHPRIVHVVGSVDRSNAGMATAVCALCSHLADHAEITLVTTTGGGAQQMLDPRVHRITLRSFTAPVLGFELAPGFSAVVRRVLRDLRADVVHVHGLWRWELHAACAAAREQGVPYVTSAHGMLLPWAFRHRWWKKRLPWRFYQRRDLCQAARIHATSEKEAQAIRTFGLSAPVRVVPHGLSLPAWVPPDNGRPPYCALFLGRLHPSKGLRLLVDAWFRLRPEGGACLVAGPDEQDHQRHLQNQIRACGLDGVFRFCGPVDQVEKWRLYRQADLFVLPSHTENFGLVVAEALACGVPVITTTGTPWEELPKADCGWMVAPEAGALAGALQEAMAAGPARRAAMGIRGRRFVETRFDWTVITPCMLALYQELLVSRAPADRLREAGA